MHRELQRFAYHLYLDSVCERESYSDAAVFTLLRWMYTQLVDVEILNRLNLVRHLHIHLHKCVGVPHSLTFSGEAVMFLVFPRVTPAVPSYQGRSEYLEL